MIYQNLSWFYRLKMVISQFATVKIQLNHPKIIPMAQGDPRGTWIPRSDDWGDALAAQQISRSSPVSATVPWGSKNSVGSGCRLDPGSQNKPKSPEKNWKKQRKLRGFWVVFWGEVTSLIFLDSSQLSGFWQKKQGGFGIDDAFHHLPSPSRFL